MSKIWYHSGYTPEFCTMSKRQELHSSTYPFQVHAHCKLSRNLQLCRRIICEHNRVHSEKQFLCFYAVNRATLGYVEKSRFGEAPALEFTSEGLCSLSRLVSSRLVSSRLVSWRDEIVSIRHEIVSKYHSNGRDKTRRDETR